jgi:deazaflavin-dependent oxidoreductase (nitroreductase family)
MANFYQRFVDSIARTKLGVRVFMPIATAIDRKLLPLSKGRLTSGAGTQWGKNICLLHARGKKTGQIRSVPLLYTEVGECLVLIASQGGAATNPAWYGNLRAHPDCEVEIGGKRTSWRARETDGEERERLWRAAVAQYPGYAVYQRRTERRIPVLLLEAPR